ncbi:MAG: alpha/beta fold hydrolase [Candidatus Margulisiibacteriota bacterium]
MASLPVYRYEWPSPNPKAVVHILHGMMEHAGRYAHLAHTLNQAGFAVTAHDHQGHGKTCSPDHYGQLDNSCWDQFLADTHTQILKTKAQYPGIPLVLFGHSMGSFLAQAYTLEHPTEPAALVLSGSGWQDSGIKLGESVARWGTALWGPLSQARLLQKLVFGPYNLHFFPTRTSCDWISRDKGEVDRYLADPACGFGCSFGFFAGFFKGLSKLFSPAQTFETLPKTLPLYLFGGSQDPVGGYGKASRALADRYLKAGLSNLVFTLYDGARHECINETNREQVYADLIAFLARFQ